MKGLEMAILFSGSPASLALYTIATSATHEEIPPPRQIHLLCMDNGVSRFLKSPINCYRETEKILKDQRPASDPVPEATNVDLKTSGLFKDLWINQYETLMPRFGNKNLACLACRLALHIRSIIYCVERLVPLAAAADLPESGCLPVPFEVFHERIMSFSESFGVKTRFPLYHSISNTASVRHYLQDFGIKSIGTGKRECIFSESSNTASFDEMKRYLDDMIPRATRYVQHRLDGNIEKASRAFIDAKDA